MSEKPVPEKKEDRRVRRTKKLLTQSLTELLQTKQINEITVKELTERADMNRGTFYQYYKDVYDMLEKIEDSMFGALDNIVSMHSDDSNGQTRAFFLDLFTFISENRDMCRVLLSPHGDMNFLHKLNTVLRERCLEIRPEFLGSGSDVDFEYQYNFVIFGCAGLIRTWVSRDCQEPAEQLADMADNMLHHGIIDKE